MSRSFDLLLVLLVAGLAWWLFGRGSSQAAAPPAPAPTVHVEPRTDASVAPAPGEEEAAPGAAPNALQWRVDDPTLAAHPALAFVVARDGDGGLERLSPVPGDAPGILRTAVRARPRALGVALARDTTEVLAWLPIAAAPRDGAWWPEEPTVRLATWVHAVALVVVAPDGVTIVDAELHLPTRRPQSALEPRDAPLVRDGAGRVLLPRHAGVTLDVVGARGSARVVDPEDGMRVTLKPR